MEALPSALTEILESLPPAWQFVQKLKIIEEDKLRANLLVCKRHLDNHLAGVNYRTQMPVGIAPKNHQDPFYLENIWKYGMLVIPRREFTEMNEETTTLFLDLLRSPPHSYASVRFVCCEPRGFVTDPKYKVLVWRDRHGLHAEDSLVICFAPSQKNSDKK